MRVTCKKCESVYSGCNTKEIYEAVGRRCKNPLCDILNERKPDVAMPVKWVEIMKKGDKQSKRERRQAAALLRQKIKPARFPAPTPNPEEVDVEAVYIEFDDAIEIHVC